MSSQPRERRYAHVIPTERVRECAQGAARLLSDADADADAGTGVSRLFGNGNGNGDEKGPAGGNWQKEGGNQFERRSGRSAGDIRSFQLCEVSPFGRRE